MCKENNEVDIEALSEALYELGKTTQELVKQFQNTTIELANIVVKATNDIVEACKETQTEEPMKSIIELAEVMRAQQNLIIDLDKIEIKGTYPICIPFHKTFFYISFQKIIAIYSEIIQLHKISCQIIIFIWYNVKR